MDIPFRAEGKSVIFRETGLDGAFVVEIEPHPDARGFFARSWCQREFLEHGLNPALVQCNISYNVKRGTLRGMHYQVGPHAEAKLVRCTRGELWDVIVDLRPQSITYRSFFSLNLSAENRLMLYVPEGFAHGFITLEDATEIFYQMSEFYSPESARGFRWDDPFFNISWPMEASVISDRDATYPAYSDRQLL
jgi:dTDP-4-dehydrorhamnose 3,5-epimerase